MCRLQTREVLSVAVGEAAGNTTNDEPSNRLGNSSLGFSFRGPCRRIFSRTHAFFLQNHHHRNNSTWSFLPPPTSQEGEGREGISHQYLSSPSHPPQEERKNIRALAPYSTDTHNRQSRLPCRRLPSLSPFPCTVAVLFWFQFSEKHRTFDAPPSTKREQLNSLSFISL